MKIEVLKTERVTEATLPPGLYVGTWSGYVITIPIADGEWQLKTASGVRGRVSVTVGVDNKGIVAVVA